MATSSILVFPSGIGVGTLKASRMLHAKGRGQRPSSIVATNRGFARTSPLRSAPFAPTQESPLSGHDAVGETSVAAHPKWKQSAISLAHQPSTLRQHRLALAVAALQFVACLIISSFPASVPRIDGFVPAILSIVFVADLITAVLLFNQSSLIGSRALLVLANGYLFSAFIVIPHALTFPGAFAPKGFLGASAQSSAWLNVFWNLGFIAAVAGYAWLKDEDHRNDASPPSTQSAFCWSAAIQIGLTCALTWVVTGGDRFMPRMFVDDLNHTPLVHYAAGTIVLLSVVALVLLWTRLTSVLDLWVMFAICMLITEKALVALGMTTRFSVGWYVSRTLVVAVSMAVLIALLSRLMRLHATVLRSEHQQRTLNAELDHRVKNVLATVSAIIAQTPKRHSTQAEYAAGLDQRIRSLARTHELLSNSRWGGVSLADIVRRELAPYATDNAEIGGPDVTLRAEAAQAMGMVLHELATNAAKHGAFAKQGGRLLLRWQWLRNGLRGRLAIEWQELGGPPVDKPSHFGYGTSTIRELIPFELGGTVDLAFASSGLRCTLEIPADWVRGALGHATLDET
jgi:two-component sensor histidine kinase